MKTVKAFNFEGTLDGFIIHAGPHVLGTITNEGILLKEIPQKDFYLSPVDLECFIQVYREKFERMSQPTN